MKKDNINAIRALANQVFQFTKFLTIHPINAI